MTSGSLNANKKIHKMAPNGWHLSISQDFKWRPVARKHYFLFLETLKVPFSCFWEHRFQLQKRYLFAPFMRSLETKEKVPLSRFKTSFGKVRNGWRADNNDVKISFIPNDKHRQYIGTFYVHELFWILQWSAIYCFYPKLYVLCEIGYCCTLMKTRTAAHNWFVPHTADSLFFVFSWDIWCKINKLFKYYEY